MKNRKICHLTTVHPALDNRIFHKEIYSLISSGYDVHYIAPGEVTETSKVCFYALQKQSNRIKRFFINSLWNLPIKAIKVNADLYHFHDSELIFTGLILKLLGKIVVYDAHENLAAAILSKHYFKSSLLKRVIARIAFSVEHTAAYFFDAIVTARPDISDTFKSHKIICTLRNFPKLSDLKANHHVKIEKTGKFSLVYVGGMTRIRGIKELIDSFTHVDNAELWLLGKFTNDDFFNECKSMDGWKNVRFFGSVAPYEVFSYIEQADAGVVTFWPEPNHLKTLATKPFEYMSCGLPVIMSDFPYWRDFFKDSALYVDPKIPSNIAKAIQELITNQEFATNMGKRNKILIDKEYNWEIESSKLIELYHTLLKD